jgi:hypothetical protein
MASGGNVLRKELHDVSYLESHPEIFQMFKEAGCYRYCEKLQGYHQGVAEAFAKRFDGEKVTLGPLVMQIDEASVAAATEMPGQGERWFKTTITKDIEFRSYLKPEFKCIIWKRDVPRSHLEEKWKQLLKVIQVYITCEGRYGRVMLYHFKLMNHFTGRNLLNFPHYLHRSLTKMAHQVQAKPEKVSTRIFHHGLIKLIVMEELQKRVKTWDYLLFWGQFEQEIQLKGKRKTPTKGSSTSRSSKRKRRALSLVQTEEPTPSPSTKTTKKNLDFDQVAEIQNTAAKKNILNLPYSDSESEPAMAEIEAPENEAFEHEAPDLEIPETSTRKRVSKSSKIKRLKGQVKELEVLERVVKSHNQALKRTSDEVRDSLQRIAKMHVKEEKKNKKLLKENQRLHKLVKCLKIKLMLKKPKTRAHPALEDLAEVVVNLSEET